MADRGEHPNPPRRASRGGRAHVDAPDPQMELRKMTTPETKDPAATPAEAAAQDAPPEAPKTKRKYGRGRREVQVLERDLTKARRRMVNAVLKGIEKWESERDRSSRKRRDGAIVDVLRNSGKALSRTLEEASKLPEDVAKAFCKRKMRKVMMPFLPW